MKFSSEDFNRSDKISREISINFLNKQKRYKEFEFDFAEENIHKYSVDLVLKKDGKVVGYAECEQSYTWKKGKYVFADTGVPNRKFKFMKYPMPVLLIKINEAEDSLIIFSARELNIYGYTKQIPNRRTGIEDMRILDKKYFECYSL